jgi:hypothetical protein
MPQPDTPSPDDVVIQQLSARLDRLEELRDAHALALSGPIIYGVDDALRHVVENRQSRRPKHTRLTFLLTTDGGYVEVVQRMVETLRHHYQEVDFIIPNFAFSAGTVFAMSGDSISMDYYSRLGPIDPQLEIRDGQRVPALGHLIQYERLLQKARDGDLTTVEAELLIRGFNQAELYQYEQARALSIDLLERWLAKYKFKNWKTTERRGMKVTPAMRRRRAVEIAAALNDTERWHSHGHGISMQVLQRDLKLKIDDFGKNKELRAAVRDYHDLLQNFMMVRSHRGVIHAVDHYLPY